jgi:hypothetical protein
MEYNDHDKPDPGCVLLLIHCVGEVIFQLKNVDLDCYSYFDLVDDICKLLDVPNGCKDKGLPFSISFCYLVSHLRNPIETDFHVLDMFKLNSNCLNIHLYVTLLNLDDSEVIRAVPEIVITDDEWEISNESQQHEGEETDSMSSHIDEEERKNENSNDEPSDFEEKHDVTFVNLNEDKVPIYVDRGTEGKLFVHESDGKVKLEVGLLFGLLLYKRDLRST